MTDIPARLPGNTRLTRPRIGDLLLEHGATAMQREPADVEAMDVQTVDSHEHRRRTQLVVFRSGEQVKLADKVLVESFAEDYGIHTEI